MNCVSTSSGSCWAWKHTTLWIPPSGFSITTMEDAATGYAAFVLELLEEIRKTCSDPIVMVEQKLDYSRWVKDGYGTGDAVIVADGTLHVVDFKYGTGVPVSAEGNSQMRLYALGALDMFGELYDIDTVVMTI